MSYYAIDFGTSNSLLTYINSNGDIRPIPLNKNDDLILKSLIFTPDKNTWFYGDEAIDQYMEFDGEGRFFRSLKKFLPEPNYTGTEVHNKRMKVSDLIGAFLRELRHRANKITNQNIEKVILGRPALYSSEPKKDLLAEDRMRQASTLAGFKETVFCPEPLAAGLDFQSDKNREKIILVADFGGGTSDFTLIKFKEGKYSQDNILGLSGIFKAGDALDGEIMSKFISRHFGSQFKYQLPFGDNVLTFPRHLLKKICSPAHITHLRERDTWEFLQEIQKFSIDEENKKYLDQLFTLVECQLGFPIFNQIEKTKIAMSKSLPQNQDQTFNFDYLGLKITQKIDAIKFQENLNPVVQKIMESMMDVFIQANLKPKDVDQVCLTGGTAQFSMIKDSLINIFGEDKLIQHNVYQSVVGGLAQFGKNLS